MRQISSKKVNLTSSKKVNLTAETLTSKVFHMGSRTIKIGSAVTVKDTGSTVTVSDIVNGKYTVSGDKKSYDARELVIIKTKAVLKNRTPVKTESDLERKLKPIYNIIRPLYLAHNKTCIAGFPCCTKQATEIHHRYKRTGFWRIITNYFLPICRQCHRYATKNSREAIEKGVSISRHAQLPYLFNKHERDLMAKHGISPP